MSKNGSFDADEPNESAPREKQIGKPGHPLFGCMKGMVTIPEGVDLTEPACPEWADLIDEMMPLPSEGKDTGS
ncbi:MAG TPA: hypothetical protein VGO49_08445 [Bradyrhizobium sp.]|jgi:hypothetical protein|nr:hypothetical protein [Bradyrhizobium sp.]